MVMMVMMMMMLIMMTMMMMIVVIVRLFSARNFTFNQTSTSTCLHPNPRWSDKEHFARKKLDWEHYTNNTVFDIMGLSELFHLPPTKFMAFATFIAKVLKFWNILNFLRKKTSYFNQKCGKTFRVPWFLGRAMVMICIAFKPGIKQQSPSAKWNDAQIVIKFARARIFCTTSSSRPVEAQKKNIHGNIFALT